MFFLFAVRRKEKPIGQVERACTKCARPTVHTALEFKSWFTFFFIPVIPFGTTYLSRCNLCGMKYKMSADLQSKVSAMAMAAKA
jgi:zinc-ribbon family